MEVDKPQEPKSFDTILTGPTSGNYELFGVVTHRGRMADSGHYVGWVREKGDQWLCYDDEVVTTVTTDDIKKLYGDAVDWHMTFICFYRRIDDLAGRVVVPVVATK